MRVIFDIDGTLIQSVAVDAELYDRAFRETFAVALPTTDWSVYRDATDAGIFAEAVERLGLPDGRAAEMQRRFVALLASVATIEPVSDESPRRREIIARAIGVDTNGDGRLGVPAVTDFSDVNAFVRMLQR